MCTPFLQTPCTLILFTDENESGENENKRKKRKRLGGVNNLNSNNRLRGGGKQKCKYVRVRLCKLNMY